MSTNNCNNILGKQLLEQGLINYKQLKKALKIQENTNQRLSSIMKKEGMVNEIELYKILSDLLNNPSIDNYNLKIKDEIDFELLDSFDARVLIEKHFLPLNINKNILKILVFDFRDKDIDRFLKTKFGDVLIEKVEAPNNVINYLIEYSYRDKLINDEINLLTKKESQFQPNLFTKGQLIFIGIISIIILSGLFFNFILTINLGLYIINIFFLFLILFKFVFPIFYMRQNKDSIHDKLQDKIQNKLPVYTILVPLINNSKSLDDLILSLKNMNYSPDKMEVIFLLKKGDNKDKKNLLNSNLPGNWKVIQIPKEIGDKTIQMKNFGLRLAKGEYITTYKATDLPEPNQLKKVVFNYYKNSKDYFCILAPYKYINNETLLSKYINVESTQIIKVAQSKPQFYNKLFPLINGTKHYKTDKLRNYGGWSNYSEWVSYIKGKDYKPVSEVSNSITYSIPDCNGINYYIKLFKNLLQNILYYNRDLFNNAKYNFKDWFVYNRSLFTPLLTPLIFMFLVFVLILDLLIDKSLLNQYLLNNIVNISAVNLLIFYILNLYFIVKSDTNLKFKEKLKMGLINPSFMIMKFYAVFKAVVKIIKNPYKLELTNPETHRDLMFMHINFKKKTSD